MLVAFLLLTSVAEWVPMRWTSTDPAALDLLKGSPVNAVLVESSHWSGKTIEGARQRSISVAALIQPADSEDVVARARQLGFDAVVLEGDFDKDRAAALRSAVSDAQMPLVELPSRSRMRFDDVQVVGTFEGLWPGIQVDHGGSAKAAPTGGPWINTNSGFLRFAKAAAPPGTPVWIANRPRGGTAITAERYMQAIADAAMVGARWVLAFDEDWMKRFYGRDERVLKDWQRIAQLLRYFESHSDWRSMDALSQLAIVQDVDTGALLSGGVLDMIAVKHTPVRTVPARKLSPEAMKGANMAVNVDPSALSDAQKEALRAFARAGGTTLSGPGTWKFPEPQPGRITLDDQEVKTLDEIWREVNSMTGRRNLGARLFNVSSMLSNLLASPDRRQTLVHFVNYSGYPVENVTVHLLGKYISATLVAPGAEPRKLEVYPIEEGTGVDVPTVGVVGTLLLE